MRPDLPTSWPGRASAGSTPADGERRLDEDDSLVDLRCSLVVVDRGRILVIHRIRGGRDDWVLPGGRPRPGEGESLAACATREALEETGSAVNPTLIAFVGEVIDPDQRSRTVEVVSPAPCSVTWLRPTWGPASPVRRRNGLTGRGCRRSR